MKWCLQNAQQGQNMFEVLNGTNLFAIHMRAKQDMRLAAGQEASDHS